MSKFASCVMLVILALSSAANAKTFSCGVIRENADSRWYATLRIQDDTSDRARIGESPNLSSASSKLLLATCSFDNRCQDRMAFATNTELSVGVRDGSLVVFSAPGQLKVLADTNENPEIILSRIFEPDDFRTYLNYSSSECKAPSPFSIQK